MAESLIDLTLSDDEFFKRVQNPATRTSDNELLFKYAHAYLENSNSTFVRCASFCVIVYAAIEGRGPSNLSSALLSQDIFDDLQFLLSKHVGQPIWMRWFTSVNMAQAYLQLNKRNYNEAFDLFARVTDNSHNITLWPPMITSHMAAFLFSASIKLKLGETCNSKKIFDSSVNFYKEGVSVQNFANYWAAKELSGANCYLCEILNEVEIMQGSTALHGRGSLLWGIFSKLFKEHFVDKQ